MATRAAGMDYVFGLWFRRIHVILILMQVEQVCP